MTKKSKKDSDTLVNDTNVRDFSYEKESRFYKILSYLGVLWVVGLFVPMKNDNSLKFHVGQGMILTIATLCLYILVLIVNKLIIANLFTKDVLLGGYASMSVVNGFGLFLMFIFNFCVIAFEVIYLLIGIRNVCFNEDKKLPFIGKYAFYK